MKLDDQVCTVVQSKNLKALGVSQDAYFSWCGDENHHVEDKQWIFVSPTLPVNSQEEDHRSLVPSCKPFAAAFNVAELGAMLPYEYMNHAVASRSGQWFGVWKCPDGYPGEQWGYRCMPDSGEYTATEAEARAAIMIHLLESGQATAEQVNRRLAV